MNRLQTRLLLAVFGVALTAVVAVAIVARQGVRHEFLKFQDVERHAVLARRAETAAAIARQLDGRCCATGVSADAARRLDQNDIVLVLADDGKTLVGSAGTALDRTRDIAAHFDGHALQVEMAREVGGRLDRVTLQFLVAGVPLSLADGRQGRAFVVPVPQDTDSSPTAAFLGSLDRQLLLATTLVGGLALVGTWLATRSAMGPIAELRAATADLANGDLGRRVRADGPEELASLAAAFNAMAIELEQQQALRRNLVHDVAHELRTPLTALRCRLETVQDGLSPDPAAAVTGLHEQVLHLSQLVDDLQELALAEARELRLQMADLGVAEVVASALGAAGLEGDPRVRVAATPGLTIHADAVRTRQVLINLMTNAARHTPEGGTITVSAGADGAMVRIDVHNTGSALDADQLARIFDRFYRTDPSRQRDTGGTGLGLAIVKHLVEAQGGSVFAGSDQTGVTVGFVATAGPAPAPPPAQPAPAQRAPARA